MLLAISIFPNHSLILHLPSISQVAICTIHPRINYTANPSALHSAWFKKANHVTTGLKTQGITWYAGLT